MRDEVKTNEGFGLEALLRVTKLAEERLSLQSSRLIVGGGGDFRKGLEGVLGGER